MKTYASSNRLRSAFVGFSLSFALLVFPGSSSYAVNEPKSPLKCKPSVFLISAPSGTGKTTVMNALMAKNPSIVKLVSLTTRAPRKGEKNGVDYRFISVKEYDKYLANNQLFEAVELFGNKYGILASSVEELIDSGHDVIVDMNYEGAKQFTKNAKGRVNIVTIYIMPPSISELRNRLISRGTDSQKIINDRMTEVMRQLEGFDRYEYVITATSADAVADEIGIIYKARTLLRNSCSKGSERMSSIEKEYAKLKI